MDIKFNREDLKWIKGSHGLPELFLKIKIPSVTQIIGSEIPDPDYEKFVLEVGLEKANQIMNAAGQKGSSMHLFIENFVDSYSKSKDVSEALKHTQIKSVEQLKKENIPDNKIDEGRNLFYKFYYSDYANEFSDILGLELGVYSPSLFYRGKLDILYKDKIYGVSLMDFKSINGKIKKGSAKEIKFKYQLGAYANALEEMYSEKKLKVAKASILCIDKQSDILHEIVLTKEELDDYKEKFKTICESYHIRKNTAYLIQK